MGALIEARGLRYSTLVPLMTTGEARACVARIRVHLDGIRRDLWRLEQAEGWRALGYDSLRACMVAEFGQGQAGLYRELQVARIEVRVSSALEIGAIPARHLLPLARLPEEEQPEAWAAIVATAPGGRVTGPHAAAVVERLADHQLINASKSNEWYTPAQYPDAAREVMGAIDLDPASTVHANRTIRATRFYTIEDDGLAQPWAGRLWVNPPYGKEHGESNAARWSSRLVAEYDAGRVTEAVLLVNAAMGNRWWAPLKRFPICFPERIHFESPEGEKDQPTNSNALIYLGPQVLRFADIFGRFGEVLAAREVWQSIETAGGGR